MFNFVFKFAENVLFFFKFLLLGFGLHFEFEALLLKLKNLLLVLLALLFELGFQLVLSILEISQHLFVLLVLVLFQRYAILVLNKLLLLLVHGILVLAECGPDEELPVAYLADFTLRTLLTCKPRRVRAAMIHHRAGVLFGSLETFDD
jgi:hypothetical protein